MLLSHIFERELPDPPSDVFEHPPRVSSVEVDVSKWMVPEELAQFDKIKTQIPSRSAKFPVMHVYQERMANNRVRQDALKMRRPEYETDDHKARLQELIDASIKIAMGYNSAGDNAKRWDKTKANTDLAARAIARGKEFNFVVVPIPSSSALTSMIANAAAKAMGTQVVNALGNSDGVKFSKQQAQTAYTKGEVKDPTDWQTPTKQLDQLMDAIAAFDERRATPQQMAQYKAQLSLADSLEQDIQRAKNFTHSQKSHMKNPKYGYGAAFYGKFSATDAAKALNGRHIMLVDDNVSSGKSFAEAAKALFAAGVLPSQIIGFALHNFV